MSIIANASNYNWSTWLLGIMRSFVSGGAAALTTGTGGAILGVPGKIVWELMGINFVLMGLYRMGEFLQLHGAPDPVALQVALKEAEESTKKTAEAVANAQAAAPEVNP